MTVVRDGGLMVSRVLTRGIVRGEVTRLWQLVHPVPIGGVGPKNVRAPWKEGEQWWLREFCRTGCDSTGHVGVEYEADKAFVPIGESTEDAIRWAELARAKAAIWDRWVHPSVMPRWAARYEVTPIEVHLEKLQALDSEDIFGAGIRYSETHRGWTRDGMRYSDTARKAFARWWDSEHPIYEGGRVWVGNPWVWRCVLWVERLSNGSNW